MTRIFWIASLLVTLLAPLSQTTAIAAEITKIHIEKGNVDAIFVTGKIGEEDAERFAAVASGIDHAVVVLDSPGGLIVPSILIGIQIRQNKYATAVTGICASSCAIIWLAGEPRMLANASHVGFHTVWVLGANGQEERFAIGDRLVLSYIKELGLSDAVAVFATAAGPKEIKWLSKIEADKMGLTTSLMDKADLLPSLAGATALRSTTGLGQHSGAIKTLGSAGSADISLQTALYGGTKR